MLYVDFSHSLLTTNSSVACIALTRACGGDSSWMDQLTPENYSARFATTDTLEEANCPRITVTRAIEEALNSDDLVLSYEERVDFIESKNLEECGCNSFTDELCEAHK